MLFASLRATSVVDSGTGLVWTPVFRGSCPQLSLFPHSLKVDLTDRFAASLFLLATWSAPNGNRLDFAALLLIPALLLFGCPQFPLTKIAAGNPSVAVIVWDCGQNTAGNHLGTVNRDDGSRLESSLKLGLALVRPRISSLPGDLGPFSLMAFSHSNWLAVRIDGRSYFFTRSFRGNNGIGAPTLWPG